MSTRDVNLPEHLHLIAAAPEGVRKLRGLILELAVRGKLVPQDPNDEPASELLKRIAQERAQLNDRRMRMKIGQTPPSSRDEWPFELPQGWEWERFGEISEIERGGSPRPIKAFLTDDPDGLNWIKIGDTDKGGKYITSTSERIRREGLTKTRMVFPGDFLLTNSMSFGRPYITQIEGCIHDGWLRICPPSALNKDYLYTLLSSPFVHRLFVVAAAGAVVMNLNAEKVRDLPIPLPPLAEQHRIVAKVDELMALCDQLEAEQTASASAHARLVATLLGTLTQSADNAELSANWQRLAEHFDTLFTTESSLDALKQTILQLAVMGKLVPQNLGDEPASKLLERVEAERKKKISEGRLKRSSPSETTQDYVSRLPVGWCATTIGGVSFVVTDGTHKTPRYVAEGVKFVSAKDVRSGTLSFDHCRFISQREHEELTRRCKPETGDILISKSGSIGTVVTVDNAEEFSLFESLALVKFPREYVASSFLKLAIQSTCNSLGEAHIKGVAVKHLHLNVLRSLPISLPPLAEQHRIVAKVDELLVLCDRLKADLADSRTRQTRLSATLIESALAAA